MSILELVEKIGSENINCQILNSSLIGSLKQRKGYAEITFGAQIGLLDLLTEKPEKVGLILWIDGDKFRDANPKKQAMEERK